jgi:alkane 1-monooxygenase
MILLAYVSPLWRRVMDKRVLAHYGGDVTLANIDPRKRDKLLAKFAPPADAAHASAA